MQHEKLERKQDWSQGELLGAAAENSVEKSQDLK